MIITAGKINRLFSLAKIITIHLGKNPMNGGKPARDRRVIIIRILLIDLILAELS